MSVVIETTVGDITVDLFTDLRPLACLNFMKLCRLKYYNFNLFHTIEQGFIAQTGDPTGKGDGGSSVWGLVEGIDKRFFEAESLPKIYHGEAGLISLVSAGNNLVGSQFFFTLGDNLSSLDGVHCVIGEVVEGQETLEKLNETIVDDSFRPYQDIRITHTVVLEDPFPDPRGFQVPERSPSPNAERLQNGRIGADEDIDDTGGKTMVEVQEMLAEREAKARATILEIVGDLPDAECAPPENVLFVCKLNPITTEDDLEIIFSRFGKVKGCEVIRDRKNGDSLQYAFVEFEDQKSCEAAYFKMDNVLIDDRRIHVDFSQSVSRVKWRGKGRGVVGSQGRLDFNSLRENLDIMNERKERERMTSEERRKTREERHRAQKIDRKNSDRDRTRRRSRPRDNTRDLERNRRRSRSRDISRYARKPDFRDRRPSSRERRRSRSKERRFSPPRSRYGPQTDRRMEYRRDDFPDSQRYSKELSDQRRAGRSRSQSPVCSARLKKPVKEQKKKKRTKKSKHTSSSEDSDESSTSESNSDSESSSEPDRKRKKKHSKSKKKKSSNKKKSKKHK